MFGEKLGWEIANWFANTDEEPCDIHTFGLPNWHSAVAREHKAAREAAVLFDQTSFAKYISTGQRSNGGAPFATHSAKAIPAPPPAAIP